MNVRLAGLVTALVAAVVLGLAYYAQYGLRLVPCELCLLERWPYRVTVVLGILALVLGGRAGRGLVGLAGLAMFINVLIAGLHAGVEFHWWASPFPECNGLLTPGASLPMLPSVSCDRGVYLLSWLPLTMTQMDFIGSICFVILLVFMVSRTRRGA